MQVFFLYFSLNKTEFCISRFIIATFVAKKTSQISNDKA